MFYFLHLVTRAGITRRARSPVWSRRAHVTLVPSMAIIRNMNETIVQNLPGCSCRNNMSPQTICKYKVPSKKLLLITHLIKS